LFGVHFFATYIPRLLITSHTIYRLRRRKIGFNTIIVGSSKKAVDLFHSLNDQKRSLGYNFVGFVNVNGNRDLPLKEALTHLGNLNDVVSIVKQYNVEEAIIAIESSEHEDINKIINKLDQTNVIIKVIPGMHEIIRGMANMTHLYGVPLIEIKHDLMPAWEENLKRIIDITASLVALIILIPVYIFLAIGVKLSSKGPVFYSHERIGRYGKPFTIYKFRSMYTDAEKNGPALSSENDKRITQFGLFMRKSRLDEFPQFYNVLIGDMSLVGPRPERQFYINQIVEKAPYYYHLQKVRPGLTSWGQVKFGYAGSV
jgi:exopolysaccharide biosynthesis polyprenyl glycosylphosphotransferase